MIGDYVMAYKFFDCDPSEPWYVGFVEAERDGWVRVGGRWFQHHRKIDRATGDRILAEFPQLEGSAYDVNLVMEITGFDDLADLTGEEE